MNPLRWVRWKVAAALAVVVVVAYLLGWDAFALSKINDAGRREATTSWSIGNLDVSLLAGAVDLQELFVSALQGDASADGGKANTVFSKHVAADVSIGELLRRRYVLEEVRLDVPQVSVVEVNSSEETDTEAATPEGETEAKPTDWLGTARRWYERLQKWRQRLPGGDDSEAEDGGSPPPSVEERWGADYDRRIAYPYAARPRFYVQRLVANGMTLSFDDSAGDDGGHTPRLTDGQLQINELSSAPSLHSQPVTFAFSGLLATADRDVSGARAASSALDVSGTFDVRSERSTELAFDAKALRIPAALVQSFVGASLSTRFVRGSIDLEARVRLVGDEELRVEPKLVFRDVELEAKEPSSTVGGFPADRFVTEFNYASRELGELAINDIRIVGTPSRPRVEWGTTLRDLIVQGGKRFAMQKLEEGKRLASEKAEKLADELQEKAAGVAGELQEEAARRFEGVELPAKETTKKALDGLRDRFFGADSEDE